VTRASFIPAYRLEAKGRRTRIRLWGAACAAYGIAALLTYCLFHAVWAKDTKDLAREQWDFTEKVGRSRTAADRFQQQADNEELELQANRAVGNQPDWSVLLAAVSADLGEEIFLRQCQLIPTDAPTVGQGPPGAAAGAKVLTAAERRYVLKLSGCARSHTAASQFVLRLEQNGLFDQVRVIKTAREPLLAGSAIGFQLECSLGQEVAKAP